MHEMGHVAQYQAGINVEWEGFKQQFLMIVTLGIYNPYPYNVTPNSNPPITNIEGYAQYNRLNSQLLFSSRGMQWVVIIW